MNKEIQLSDEKLLQAVDNFNSSVATDDISASTFRQHQLSNWKKLMSEGQDNKEE